MVGSSIGRSKSIHMHVKVRHRKVHSSSSIAGNGKGDHEATGNTTTPNKRATTTTSQKDKLIKSTVTIRKIIVRRTLSSTSDQLIIKKSRVMQTKKIVTIRSALI
ncbi:hypothetical protein PIROE2DRAFT_8797 [Piromyces sp. E2]|nr:hypothetical protein PIROE2DRAFT_8797 [Piromyces sp. E2]|eukprot:OUM64409.1 hypothetical protein PIROE2DRAFT_8797 [Piromyces sp. E2]